MTVEIRANYLVSCENEPVEKLFKRLQKDFPQLNPISEQTLQLQEERDDAIDRAKRLSEENKILSRDNECAMRRIEELTDDVAYRILKVNNLARERDELQRKFEGAGVPNDRLKDMTLPALPEGMRLADHEKYGRVVVSPETNCDAECFIFYLSEESSSGWDWNHVDPFTLTFLEEEPAPAPLPKPEDCKAGDLYIAQTFDREVVANRCGLTGGSYPWFVSSADDYFSDWCKDEQITLLSRLLPDRQNFPVTATFRISGAKSI